MLQVSRSATLGDFGFAHHHTIQRRKWAHLHAMTQTASQAGAKCIYSCGLDTENLRKALYSMSTSLLSTRNGPSSLAGGTLRISEPEK
jgi:hypothetical protein